MISEGNLSDAEMTKTKKEIAELSERLRIHKERKELSMGWVEWKLFNTDGEPVDSEGNPYKF